MIGFTFYKTYGVGCEHFNFRKIRSGRWQRVKRWYCFYIPVGGIIREHDCNYYLENEGEQ